MKIALIALGCEKNVISSEQMLYSLTEAGYELTDAPEEADVTVINTCAFIEAAKREAVEQILEVCSMPCRVIVAGCLAERYGEEILKEIPEVSGIVGCGSFLRIGEAVERLADGESFAILDKPEKADISAPRIVTSPSYSAYIKIAEGCDNRCSYCVIPGIRGSYRSRSLEDIVGEAEAITENGAKELILIAQDTSRWGVDLYGKKRLSELITRLCGIEGLSWLRLHYLYPEMIDDELIDTIRKNEKVVRYLDIPIQHCSDKILRAMNRRYDKKLITDLFKKLRKCLPGVVIRTSVIVGFPGETQNDFDELAEFLRENKLERAGVFAYSREEGSPACDMAYQIEEDVKSSRLEIIADLQMEIMDEYNRSLMGRALEILTEGFDKITNMYYGRSFADSPEVEWKVFFTSESVISPGEIVFVRLTDTLDGDLIGTAEE